MQNFWNYCNSWWIKLIRSSTIITTSWRGFWDETASVVSTVIYWRLISYLQVKLPPQETNSFQKHYIKTQFMYVICPIYRKKRTEFAVFFQPKRLQIWTTAMESNLLVNNKKVNLDNHIIFKELKPLICNKIKFILNY